MTMDDLTQLADKHIVNRLASVDEQRLHQEMSDAALRTKLTDFCAAE